MRIRCGGEAGERFAEHGGQQGEPGGPVPAQALRPLQSHLGVHHHARQRPLLLSDERVPPACHLVLLLPLEDVLRNALRIGNLPKQNAVFNSQFYF